VTPEEEQATRARSILRRSLVRLVHVTTSWTDAERVAWPNIGVRWIDGGAVAVPEARAALHALARIHGFEVRPYIDHFAVVAMHGRGRTLDIYAGMPCNPRRTP
jgi:hypothetical protein